MCLGGTPPLPIASHNLGPGLVIGWSGADQRFRLCPKSGPGVFRHSDWRSISTVSASGIVHRSRDTFSWAGSSRIFHLGTGCAGVWWSKGSLRDGAASLLFLKQDVLSWCVSVKVQTKIYSENGSNCDSLSRNLTAAKYFFSSPAALCGRLIHGRKMAINVASTNLSLNYFIALNKAFLFIYFHIHGHLLQACMTCSDSEAARK